MKGVLLGLKEALRLTLENIKPLRAENVDLADSGDRVAAADCYALVDSPSADISRKDGYAVLHSDIIGAAAGNPVRLRLLGSIAAGDEKDIQIRPGTTVRVLTGARIPAGADVVVAEEFAKQVDDCIQTEIYTEIGKNILPRGSDVASKKRILRRGQSISPVMIGLLAAAGYGKVPVFKNPVVGIIGTGDEIIEPDQPLTEGKLYASNITALAGWCHKHKMKPLMTTVKDDCISISGTLKALSEETDAVITCGGAWTGDRDMVAQALDGIGWKMAFHGIRMGPGKAVGFGMLAGKPVFILPGDPISNLMGFLQIALPGLLALSGHANPGLPKIKAGLASELRKRESDWTDFFFGTVDFHDESPIFHLLEKRSRLCSIVDANALASVPEGVDRFLKGSVVSIQLLR